MAYYSYALQTQEIMTAKMFFDPRPPKFLADSDPDATSFISFPGSLSQAIQDGVM